MRGLQLKGLASGPDPDVKSARFPAKAAKGSSSLLPPPPLRSSYSRLLQLWEPAQEIGGQARLCLPAAEMRR